MWLRKWLGICLILAVAACVSAARLEWDANTESDLAGYKIHYASAHGPPYSHTVDVGNVTEWPIPVEWPRDQDYYFAATAYNQGGYESGYSNGVVYLADNPLAPATATDIRISFSEVARMATDNFTAADGTTLSDHDANWVAFQYGIPSIASNRVAIGSWATGGARYTGSTADLCQIVMNGAVNTIAQDYVRVCVRATSGGDQYAAYPVVTGGNVTGIILTKNGSWLGTLTGASASTTSDVTIKITATGTSSVTVEGFINGTSLGTAVDSSSPLGAGNPAFFSYGLAGGVYLDDWTDGAAAAGLSIQVSASDGFKGGESLARASTFRNVILDGIKGTESQARIGTFPKTSTDGAKFAEALARGMNAQGASVDGFNGSESLARILTALNAAADGIKASDQPARISAMRSTATDAAKLSDLASRVATLRNAATDGLDMSEILARVIRVARTASDGIKVSESVIGQASMTLSISDGVKAGDAAARSLTIRAAVVDGAKLSDLLALAAAFAPSISDGFIFSETLAADLGGLFEELISDGFKTSESLSAAAQFVRAITDGAKLSDALAGILASYRSASDGVSVSDSAARISRLSLVGADGFVISDATIGDIVTAIIQALAEDGIAAGDSTSATAHFDITVSDGAKFSETVSTVMQLLAAIADGFKASDSTREGAEVIPQGRVHVNFTSRAATIEFASINGGKIIFTVRRPEIDFTIN